MQATAAVVEGRVGKEKGVFFLIETHAIYKTEVAPPVEVGAAYPSLLCTLKREEGALEEVMVMGYVKVWAGEAADALTPVVTRVQVTRAAVQGAEVRISTLGEMVWVTEMLEPQAARQAVAAVVRGVEPTLIMVYRDI